MERFMYYTPRYMTRMSVDDIHAMGSVVYFIFAGEELLYIGQSRNFKHRVKMHRIRFDEEADLIGDMRLKTLTFSAIPVPPEKLDDVEYQYIREYVPPYNRDYMPSDVFDAYNAVRVAKMEVVMAQLKLEEVLMDHRRRIANRS